MEIIKELDGTVWLPCSICGSTGQRKEFLIALQQRSQNIILCNDCGKTVADKLSSSYPEELPIFVKAMQKL